MQLQLTAAETKAYNGIKETLRIRITREIKIRTQALILNLISGFHLIARLTVEIRAELTKKEGKLTTIALTKAEEMQIEPIIEEKKKKYSVGTNGKNDHKTVLIN
jgi:hypothetical protein